ncbi:MAG TPA: hypothetical protein VNE39_01365 [Planctomycetota bacterium]|nr:hypothetical protein [Planctomycetota bacterium]
MLHFPTRVFNERIAVFVDSFYEEIARLYRAQAWGWEEPRRADATWQHPDFAVRVAARHKDGAARTLELKARNLPGVADVDDAGRVTLQREHRFRVDIPRSYPSHLGAIEVRAMTTLYHPRLNPSGRGHACIFVNGEIDRVLWSIVRHILLDPDYVQPPKLFRGVDRGMNLMAMAWYEANPRGIHKRLLDLWAQGHGKEEFTAAAKRTGGVRIDA